MKKLANYGRTFVLLIWKKRFIGLAAMVLVVALSLPQMIEANDGLDQAMQAFIQAMQSRNSQGVLAAFSRKTPWRYVTFSSFTKKLNSRASVTYAEMARDFKARGGYWYDKFMENRPTEHFRDEYFRGQKWPRYGNTFFPGPKESSGLYIKWRQEGGNWVIAEIGEYLT
jgi:hypothetical protein